MSVCNFLSSGRVQSDAKKFISNIDSEEDQLALLRSIARGESTRKGAVRLMAYRYAPLYKHPLPISERRYNHQIILDRVLTCKIEHQARAAVTIGDPWVLEEVYMRGAPCEVPCASGYRPIHIAVQQNRFECIMVLLNIGVNINVTTVSGITPLYLAYSAGATQAVFLLEEQGAKLRMDPQRIAPGVTVLETITRKTDNNLLTKRAPIVGKLPPLHTQY